MSQVTVTDLIENYPGIPDGINGFDLAERLKTQAVQFGLKTASGDVTAVTRKKWGDRDGWEIAAGGMRYGALAVIVATGAIWRRLGVPGEERFIGKGVSFCATCDGPFYRNREVAVVGGGDTAIQEAIYLTRFAKKVTVVHRRDRLRATAILQKRALENPKIAFAWNSVVESIDGLDLVQWVRLKDVKTGDLRELPADGVFIFVGLTPNTAPFQGLDRPGSGRLRHGGREYADIGARDLRLRGLHRQASPPGRHGLRRRGHGGLLRPALLRGDEGRGLLTWKN